MAKTSPWSTCMKKSLRAHAPTCGKLMCISALTHVYVWLDVCNQVSRAGIRARAHFRGRVRAHLNICVQGHLREEVCVVTHRRGRVRARERPVVPAVHDERLPNDGKRMVEARSRSARRLNLRTRTRAREPRNVRSASRALRRIGQAKLDCAHDTTYSCADAEMAAARGLPGHRLGRGASPSWELCVQARVGPASKSRCLGTLAAAANSKAARLIAERAATRRRSVHRMQATQK
eukprot:3175726-Pleurochrysis_carterae.AAC.2